MSKEPSRLLSRHTAMRQTGMAGPAIVAGDLRTTVAWSETAGLAGGRWTPAEFERTYWWADGSGTTGRDTPASGRRRRVGPSVPHIPSTDARRPRMAHRGRAVLTAVSRPRSTDVVGPTTRETACRNSDAPSAGTPAAVPRVYDELTSAYD